MFPPFSTSIFSFLKFNIPQTFPTTIEFSAPIVVHVT